MILLSHFLKFGLAAGALVLLAGCTPDYSPDTYNANAVQQANKVDQAVVVGFRQVAISAAGTVGAVTGGAAGGILGAQVGPNDTASALGAVGGGVVGSLLGTGIEHATGDTVGWEYIVQKSNGDLLSVTQREPTPLPVGQKVLVISGAQARIIPDYSVAKEPPPKKEEPKPAEKPKAEEKPAAAPVPVGPAVPVIPVVPVPAPATVPETAPAVTPLSAPEETGTSPAASTPPAETEPAKTEPAATAAPTPLAPAAPAEQPAAPDVPPS